MEPESTKNASGQERVGSGDWLDAGSVSPSPKRYKVTWPHDHKNLKIGDIVVLVETPRLDIWLLRESDMTLHPTKCQFDQYVHLMDAEVPNTQPQPTPPNE